MNVILVVAVMLVGLIGWVVNILKLAEYGLDVGITIELALRCIGVVIVPLGAVMGLFV
jgi:hypothetical protein